jgi:hypothetical protein
VFGSVPYVVVMANSLVCIRGPGWAAVMGRSADPALLAHFFRNYFLATRAMAAQPNGFVRTSTCSNPATASLDGNDDGSTGL